MEYLVTYGWAILIIAIVLAGLFALGIFNFNSFSSRARPGGCGWFWRRLRRDGRKRAPASYYGKAVQTYTPSGYATIDRATFATLYQEVRLKAITSRNIRACWKRAGLWPLNRQRIYPDPEVANFERTTPDYQPPRLRDSLWVTPSKPEDYNDIGLQLCAVTTPSKHLPIQKLIKGGVQEITANTILKGALWAIRKHAVN